MKKKKTKVKSKRKKKRKVQSASPATETTAPAITAGESQISVASTVAWLLCCLMTLLAMVITLVTLIVHRSYPSDGSAMLGSAFLFVSLITGVLTLILSVVCHRVRDFPPPKGITVGTSLIGASAILLWLADQLLSRG